ncbi:hypothetical protein GOP47_0022164 [Adiantum capillus-veneris]|uniref:Uncharacterized protein n=1 Tax=Adiantum capillus-veneris TaxID=13818 RepID=A0A9D4U979_ADICA|nr:hypothetical protein GOP47_0022164 [Adiantum capillus-veneris]
MDNLTTLQLLPPTTLALDSASTGLAAPPAPSLPGFVSATTVLLAETAPTLMPSTHAPTGSIVTLPDNPHALNHYEHITEELEKLLEDSFDFSSVLAKNDLTHNRFNITSSSTIDTPLTFGKRQVSSSIYPSTNLASLPQLKKPADFEVPIDGVQHRIENRHGMQD